MSSTGDMGRIFLFPEKKYSISLGVHTVDVVHDNAHAPGSAKNGSLRWCLLCPCRGEPLTLSKGSFQHAEYNW